MFQSLWKKCLSDQISKWPFFSHLLSPYFRKMYTLPPLRKKLYISPLFSQNVYTSPMLVQFTFFCFIYVSLLTPYFDHDAFTCLTRTGHPCKHLHTYILKLTNNLVNNRNWLSPWYSSFWKINSTGREHYVITETQSLGSRLIETFHCQKLFD